MSRVGKLLVTATIALTLLGQVAAHAATPQTGTISKSKKSLSWTGGPFTVSYMDYSGATTCEPPAESMCDHFALKVNLGNGALIDIRVKTASPNTQGGVQPVQGDDYDLYVYAPDGTLVAESASEAGNEKLTFRHRARYGGKAYDVAVKPWAVLPGSTYNGVVKAITVGN